MTTAATTSTKMGSKQLEANANALKARMDAIKNQNMERKSMTTSAINSITSITDEEAYSLDAAASGDTAAAAIAASTASTTSTAATTAVNDQMSKLLAELQAAKEKEKAYLEQMEAIEEENEKFQLVAFEFEKIFHQLIRDKDDSELKMKQEIIDLTKERGSFTRGCYWS